MQNMSEETKVIRVDNIIDMPSAIESFYFLENTNLLALARADNTIEIWTTTTWIQLVKIYGLKNCPLRKVFMIQKEITQNVLQNLRLFTVGLNGYLIEWSLFTLKPKVYLELIKDILSKSWKWNLGRGFKC
jgi:hypothetical protein